MFWRRHFVSVFGERREATGIVDGGIQGKILVTAGAGAASVTRGYIGSTAELIENKRRSVRWLPEAIIQTRKR
jgi:hypothetical protein